MIMDDFGNPDWGNYILDAYKSSSNVSVEDLDYFKVIVYTKLLASTVISFLASPEDLNMRSETLEAMKKQTAIFKVLAGRTHNITGITIPELESILNTIE
jgi:hypothetical protein